MQEGISVTRKASPVAKVYCLPHERQELEMQAKATGLSLSSYLLRVGLGYQVPGILDNKKVEELARINGDLGRMGGLLKLWLTDDPKTAHIGAHTIRAVLSKVEDSQTELVKVMQTVVRPRASKGVNSDR